MAEKEALGVRHINIKELDYFTEMIESGSITKAAANVYISPQGLSNSLKKMEAELGVELLHRSNSGVVPNEYGKIVAEKSKMILKLYEEMQYEIERLKQKEHRVIKLVSAYGALKRMTPDYILEYSHKESDTNLDYMEFPDCYVDAMVMEEKADVGLAIGPIMDPGLEAVFLYEEEVQLLVRKDDPLSKFERVSFKDIENRKFIIESSMFKIHDLFLENCKRHGFQPNIIFQTSGYSLCHKLCKQGRGISLTLEKNCKDMLDDELVCIPFDEEFKWRIYVITKKEKTIEAYVNGFLEYTKSWNIV